MRQIWIPRVGPPDVLDLRTAPDPQPGVGAVRIRTAAAGVNFADLMARLGLYPDAPPLPCVVGYEVAGTIDAVGAGVRDAAVGDPVLAITRFGGYSDVVVVPADQAVKVPPGMTLTDAASLPVNSLTAWLMVVRLAALQPGERILIHSAAGGVGLMAVQLSRARGATVIGVASRGKHDRLRALGVAECIDSQSENVEKAVMRVTQSRGVDVILDAVGGASFARSYRCLAPLGRLFLFGASSLAPGKKRRILSVLWGLLRIQRFHPMRLMNDNRGVFGINLGHLWDQKDLLRLGLEQIIAAHAAGQIQPIVDRTFPFTEAAAAHAYIHERRAFGKVLLVP